MEESKDLHALAVKISGFWALFGIFVIFSAGGGVIIPHSQPGFEEGETFFFHHFWPRVCEPEFGSSILAQPGLRFAPASQFPSFDPGEVQHLQILGLLDL